MVVRRHKSEGAEVEGVASNCCTDKYIIYMIVRLCVSNNDGVRIQGENSLVELSW